MSLPWITGTGAASFSLSEAKGWIHGLKAPAMLGDLGKTREDHGFFGISSIYSIYSIFPFFHFLFSFNFFHSFPFNPLIPFIQSIPWYRWHWCPNWVQLAKPDFVWFHVHPLHGDPQIKYSRLADHAGGSGGWMRPKLKGRQLSWPIPKPMIRDNGWGTQKTISQNAIHLEWKKSSFPDIVHLSVISNLDS